MGIKISKPTPIFVDNMSVVFIKTNYGSNLNKKYVALSYPFVREHVAKNDAEARKIHTRNIFSDPFTKPMVSNDSHKFYRDCTVNG